MNSKESRFSGRLVGGAPARFLLSLWLHLEGEATGQLNLQKTGPQMCIKVGALKAAAGEQLLSLYILSAVTHASPYQIHQAPSQQGLPNLLRESLYLLLTCHPSFPICGLLAYLLNCFYFLLCFSRCRVGLGNS